MFGGFDVIGCHAPVRSSSLWVNVSAPVGWMPRARNFMAMMCASPFSITEGGGVSVNVPRFETPIAPRFQPYA